MLIQLQCNASEDQTQFPIQLNSFKCQNCQLVNPHHFEHDVEKMQHFRQVIEIQIRPICSSKSHLYSLSTR